MHHYFLDYYWKNGKPYGQERIEPDRTTEKAYRIVIDPYFKRITVEVYEQGHFSFLAYDSALFDFRRLTPVSQNAWKKEMVGEDVYLIRNEEDRIIVKEVYRFTNNRCRECRSYYPNDLLVSVQKMYYQEFDDPFNGVILYDSQGKPVTMKEYTVDQSSGEFHELLNEYKETVDEHVNRVLQKL